MLWEHNIQQFHMYNRPSVTFKVGIKKSVGELFFFFITFFFLSNKIMNQVRVALNKLPPGATIKILRKVYNLPTSAARLILKDVTKPRSGHKPWIYKEPPNSDWSGVWIGENVRKLDRASLMKRINDADLVFFYVHGNILSVIMKFSNSCVCI